MAVMNQKDGGISMIEFQLLLIYEPCLESFLKVINHELGPSFPTLEVEAKYVA